MNPKLVRNRIPSIIEQNKNRTPRFYYAEDQEYWEQLKEKLLEEVHEFLASEEPIELADILEVIEAIATYKNVPLDELTHLKSSKALTHGTFSEKIILASIQEG